MKVSRRSWLHFAGFGSLLTGVAAFSRAVTGQTAAAPVPHEGHGGHHGHLLGTVGRVDPIGLDPMVYLRSWNFSHLPPDERVKFYRETPRPDGTTLREYEIFAVDREIEVAPGVRFPAWTYNGEVPGPTIRASEGDRLRVRFLNQGTHPHTIHFHGWHPPEMDGSLPEHEVLPGESFTYEFDAEPFGLHLYHCHSTPLADHIAKGLYGTFIIDPAAGRAKADELVMVQNGFDTNFDRENEVYAVNTVAFAYEQNPIRVKRGELVRIYLVNLLEFDLLNSFHIHANFFDRYPTGTRLESTEFTDTITQGQGQRDILELRFPYPGKYMFHAHVSEFAELGWMGFFEVVD